LHFSSSFAFAHILRLLQVACVGWVASSQASLMPLDAFPLFP
jgi:hypothetical protein